MVSLGYTFPQLDKLLGLVKDTGFETQLQEVLEQGKDIGIGFGSSRTDDDTIACSGCKKPKDTSPISRKTYMIMGLFIGIDQYQY